MLKNGQKKVTIKKTEINSINLTKLVKKIVKFQENDRKQDLNCKNVEKQLNFKVRRKTLLVLKKRRNTPLELKK